MFIVNWPQIKAELMYMYMILNVSLSPKWETVIFIWTLSPVKCALSRLEAKAVSQGCAWSKNVLKMTFSLVTTCVSVTLFLSPENKAYLFAQRFNVISFQNEAIYSTPEVAQHWYDLRTTEAHHHPYYIVSNSDLHLNIVTRVMHHGSLGPRLWRRPWARAVLVAEKM